MIELKRSYKFFSVLLAVLLALSALAPAGVSGIELPENVNAADAEAAVPKLNTLIKALLSVSGKTDIKTEIYEKLYSDEVINALFSGIYGAMSENADSLSVIGVVLTPASVSRALAGYPDISKAAADCADLKAVVEKSKSFHWKVRTKKGFGAAAAAMLSPFNELLNTVLCSGTLKINSFLSIKGSDGYQAAVVPLLTSLGCPSVMSTADFAAAAKADRRKIMKNISSMLLDCIDKLVENPVSEACSTLPKTAYYISSGKLSASLQALLQPLSLKIAGIFTIPGISKLMSKTQELEKSFDLNSMLKDTGGGNFKLPEIDLAGLAECGTAAEQGFASDTGAALITLLRWALEALRLNADTVFSIPEFASLSPVLNKLLEKDSDDIIRSLITILTLSPESVKNPFRWSYPQYTPAQISFTPRLTEHEYAEVLDKIDPLLTEFIQEEQPEETIEKVLRKKIYSNGLLSSLVTGIFSALDKKETEGILSLLGIPVSTEMAAAYLKSTYPRASRLIAESRCWKNVNTDRLFWGFVDGDRDGFESALVKALSSFTPLLMCVTAEKSFSLFDAIEIPGSDGYNTAVIPLLEALGCRQENIKTYDEYLASASPIEDILNPVFSLIDEICARPIRTLCNILPNMVYFIDGGLLSASIENLLYPLKAVLEKTGLSELSDAFAKQIKPLDLNGTAAELIGKIGAQLTLPPPDLKKLAALGTAETLTGKQTFSGTAAQYTYIKADGPAVILTLLRYLVTSLTAAENADALKGLLDGMMQDKKPSGKKNPNAPDMFAMFADNLGAKFSGMTVDEIIEWLYDLLFRETPPVAVNEKDDFVPTVIYEGEKHASPKSAAALTAVLAVFAAAVLILLSKTGALDPIKEKRRKRKETKRRKKETSALAKLGVNVAESGAEEAEPTTEVGFSGSASEKRLRMAEKRLRKSEKRARHEYKKALRNK